MKITKIREYNGFRYVIRANCKQEPKRDLIWLNGYVEIPKDNLLYDLGICDNSDTYNQFNVHDGISYANKMHNVFDWAIGFSTMDLAIADKEITFEFVEDECKKLIDQITQLSPQKEINDAEDYNYHED